MKITYQQLIMAPMAPVLERLSKERMPLPEAYKLMKMSKAIKEEVSIAMEIFEKIGQEFGTAHETGGLKKLPNGFHQVEEAKQAGYEAAIQNFLKIEAEINKDPINADSVFHVANGNFSAVELEAISPLFA